MNLAIVHYHLNRGGVTSVIRNHLRALSSAGGASIERVAILYGGRRQGWNEAALNDDLPFEVNLFEVAGLGYDDESPIDSNTLAGRVADTLEGWQCDADSTVLHVHNHALGKNASWPSALATLAERGYALLLQIHDFAEDFRPANYAKLIDAGKNDGAPAGVYPLGSKIHYAVLNGRDRGILQTAVAPDGHLHLLPNPVVELPDLPARDSSRQKLSARFGIAPDQRFFLYPVRGIRRKNVGEMLLWGALLQSAGAWCGMTLTPLNPVEAKSYGRWKQLAGELKLPCGFELGEANGLSFEENLSAADAILTTSVAEGFGMVFLEAWLANRALVGRDLPEITADFVSAGIDFPQLSSVVRVPVDWIGRDVFVSELVAAYQSAAEQYEIRSAAGALKGLAENLIANDTVDFALLSSERQRVAIESVAKDEGCRDQILELNPTLKSAIESPPREQAGVIRRNAAAVREHFSPAVIGKRLGEIYHVMLAGDSRAAVNGALRADLILESFLDLRRLHPIRLES